CDGIITPKIAVSSMVTAMVLGSGEPEAAEGTRVRHNAPRQVNALAGAERLVGLRVDHVNIVRAAAGQQQLRIIRCEREMPAALPDRRLAEQPQRIRGEHLKLARGGSRHKDAASLPVECNSVRLCSGRNRTDYIEIRVE